MTMPTQAQLDKRAEEAEKRIKTLRDSYDTFLASWEKIMDEENTIKKELLGHVDTAKMHAILTHIDSIS